MSVKVYMAVTDGNRYLSDHFQVRDFACRDGSAEVPVDEDLVVLLEKLFASLDCLRIRVCAGYRSAAYARRTGRTKDRGHMEGRAVDIICFDRQRNVIPAAKVLRAVDELGHQGGAAYVSPACVHLDTGEGRVRYDETSGGFTAMSSNSSPGTVGRTHFGIGFC